MKGVLVSRVLQEDAAGGYRSRAIEEAIEVEHLKGVLVEKELQGVAEGCSQTREARRRRRSGTCFRNLATPL